MYLRLINKCILICSTVWFFFFAKLIIGTIDRLYMRKLICYALVCMTSGGSEGKHYKHPLPAHKFFLYKSVFFKKIIYKSYKNDQFLKNCLWSFSFQDGTLYDHSCFYSCVSVCTNAVTPAQRLNNHVLTLFLASSCAWNHSQEIYENRSSPSQINMQYKNFIIRGHES